MPLVSAPSPMIGDDVEVSALQVAGGSDAEAGGDGRGGVARTEDVVLRLGARQEA
jgi:hypothetical protein